MHLAHSHYFSCFLLYHAEIILWSDDLMLWQSVSFIVATSDIIQVLLDGLWPMFF